MSVCDHPPLATEMGASVSVRGWDMAASDGSFRPAVSARHGPNPTTFPLVGNVRECSGRAAVPGST